VNAKMTVLGREVGFRYFFDFEGNRFGHGDGRFYLYFSTDEIG
jgi:hypothetical protein